MDFKSAQAFLDGRISYERLNNFNYGLKEFNLDRFRDFLKRSGIDFEQLKYIHVAGSKGKGSVCTMFSQYFDLKGMKVGLFTSPHIHSVCERIQLNNVNIPEQRFAEYVGELVEFVHDETYFEILNAVAFKYFLDEGVDYAILEVGLGGRLDCTNVVRPVLSLITRLELEHTGILGDSLEQIAAEKLGIVKDGVPVLVGQQSKEGREIVKKLCPRAQFVDGGEDVIDQNGILVKAGLYLIDEFEAEGFEQMIRNFKMKGRFDMRLINGKQVLFDMAHTEASMRALFEKLSKNFPGEKFVVIFAMLKGKNVEGVSRIISEYADEVICSSSSKERGIDAGELAGYFKFAKVISDPVEALEAGLKKSQLLVVTGSTYLLEKTLPRD